MKLKELRIQNFSGIAKATLRFDELGRLSSAVDGDFPGLTGGGTGKPLLLAALDWVLFGREAQPQEAPIHNECSVELEFDNYAVYRKRKQDTPGASLRLFKYGSNSYCCVATVKDLSTEKVEETQKTIEEIIGFSDISFLADHILTGE